MITCTQPNPGRIEGVTGGVNAIGCRISFILDSQKRREWGKAQGRGDGLRQKYQNSLRPSCHGRSSSENMSPSFQCPSVVSSDLSVLNPHGKNPHNTRSRLSPARRRRHRGQIETIILKPPLLSYVDANVVKQPIFKNPSSAQRVVVQHKAPKLFISSKKQVEVPRRR